MYSADKSSWLNPDIEYLFNFEIYEYDMKSAGLSLIRQFRLLPPSKITELMGLEKRIANIAIGNLQREIPGFSAALLERFAEMRAVFIKANKLTDQQIVSVKKDAIFTIGSCAALEFGEIMYVPKHNYSSYVRLTENANIELYYGDGVIDVKGIGDVGIARHQLYMMSFLNKVIGQLESKNGSIRNYLNQFITKYRSMELDEGFYLEFNNRSATVDPVFNYLNVLKPLIQLALKEIP